MSRVEKNKGTRNNKRVHHVSYFREVDVIGVLHYENTRTVCFSFPRRVWILQKKVEEAFETSARGSTTINIMFNMLNLLGK
uniref:Uncharacterized protein n=1 Tax=Populus trichocarpa TaxID=3694 RepID=B9ID22_POPTR